MVIEHLLKRANGTVVTMPNPGDSDTEYHFKPKDGQFDSPHVATVKNAAHIERFLSITEGFRELGAAAPEPVVEPGPQYQGLAAVDPDSASNKWLDDFAQNIMKVSDRSKPDLAGKLKADFDVDMDYHVCTATDLIREYAKRFIAEERKAADAAQEIERQRAEHGANA